MAFILFGIYRILIIYPYTQGEFSLYKANVKFLCDLLLYNNLKFSKSKEFSKGGDFFSKLGKFFS
jgi:hypothetical protein